MHPASRPGKLVRFSLFLEKFHLQILQKAARHAALLRYKRL